MSVLAAGLILGQLAGAAPRAGDAPVLSLGDRTEVRARTRLTTSGVAADAETTPLASLVMRGRRTDLSLGYALHVAYIDFVDAPTPVANPVESQSAQLSFGYLATRELRFYVAGDGYYGKQFTESLVAPTTLGPTPLPTTTTFVPPDPIIYSLSYRAELGFSYRLAPRWELAASALYGGGQGLNTESRRVIPRYYGPSATVTLGYEATKADRLATGVRATYTVTPKTGANFFNTAANETWTHTFDERTTGTLGAGLAWQRTHDRAGAPATTLFFPDGQLGVTHKVPLGVAESLSFEATGRTGLTYDPVLRASLPQASAGAGVSWTRTLVGASTRVDYLTTIRTDPQQPTASQISGSVMMWYLPMRLIRVETGFRAYRQELDVAGLGNAAQTGTTQTQPNVVQPNGIQWAAFVAVVLAAPPVQL
jgi:hypothetical protein